MTLDDVEADEPRTDAERQECRKLQAVFDALTNTDAGRRIADIARSLVEPGTIIEIVREPTPHGTHGPN